MCLPENTSCPNGWHTIFCVKQNSGGKGLVVLWSMMTCQHMFGLWMLLISGFSGLFQGGFALVMSESVEWITMSEQESDILGRL